MLQIIGVPIDSVGRAGGTEHSPGALRRLGLVDKLKARRTGLVADVGDLDVRVRGQVRDPGTGVVAWPDIAAMSAVVADAVTSSLWEGNFPLLLGGCCALEPAAVSGVHRVFGSVGLAHVDGHLDVYNGVTSPTGEAADMPNSVLLGLGPSAWVSAIAKTPVLTGADLVVVGHRDPDELTDGSVDIAVAHGIYRLHADEVRADPSAAGAVAASRLNMPTWVHLDVDVLDQEEFPATDYLLPGGLTLEELREALMGIFAGGRVVGFSLGCYNPEKDPDGGCGQRLVDVLVDVLAGPVN
jgi:arginase